MAPVVVGTVLGALLFCQTGLFFLAQGAPLKGSLASQRFRWRGPLDPERGSLPTRMQLKSTGLAKVRNRCGAPTVVARSNWVSFVVGRLFPDLVENLLRDIPREFFLGKLV